MSEFQIGTAARDITPDYPIWAHGYSARTRKSSGVRERLSLGCMAVGNSTETVLIVTTDMLGIRHNVCLELYELLRTEVGIAFPNVLITGSHTHFAPALQPHPFASPKVGMVEPDARFVSDVKAKLVEAASEAMRSMEPALLETTRIQVPQALFNRRTRKADGSVQTNFLYPENQAEYEFRPVDPEMTVLRARDEHGIRAALVNFGCHPVTGCSPDDDNYRYSADYPYHLRQTIAEKWKCPVFFTLGSAGDTVPINRRDDCRERLGSLLGNSAILAERTFAQEQDTTISASVTQLEAETIFETNPAETEAAMEEARDEAIALEDSPENGPDSAEYKAARKVYGDAANACLRARLYPGNRFAIPIQFLTIGTTTLVALPFEVLSEISLSMKARFPNTVLVSCAGGYQGYLPCAHEYERGGYEASASSTHFEIGTGDRILAEILSQLAG